MTGGGQREEDVPSPPIVRRTPFPVPTPTVSTLPTKVVVSYRGNQDLVKGLRFI